MTICLLEIPSNILHRDSEEAKKQLEREAALEQQRRRHVVTSEEVEEIKTEELETKKKVNFSLDVGLELLFGNGNFSSVEKVQILLSPIK